MKIAIVTGASSGMGKWFSWYLPCYFKDIDEIWLIGRNVKRLREVQKRVKISSKVVPMDITKEEHRQILRQKLQEEKCKVKVLVNSAGLGKIGSFEELPEEEQVEMIQVNCEGLTRMIKICLPFMSENSNIINLSSAAAFVPQPDFAVYAAGKSYVLSLSEALGRELRKRKIQVTAVCPGCVDTPFFDVAQKHQKMKSYKIYFMSKDKEVVKQALLDAKKGKSRSVYGMYMKMFYFLCKYLPTSLLLKFM